MVQGMELNSAFHWISVKKEEVGGGDTLKIKHEADDMSQGDHMMDESGDLAQKEAAFLLFSKFTKEVRIGNALWHLV